jgi:hypothetical protein
MNGNAIQRPEFSDGQILDASDLNLSVDYSRDEDARHARYSHSWGITFGYDLKINGSQVTVAAGVAIDGRGKQLVLANDQVLDPASFGSAHVFDPALGDAWYPVYVHGIAPTPVTQTSVMGACAGTDQPTRLEEDVQFAFGPSGLTNNSTAPYTTPAPTDPTDPPGSLSAWDVLIGFVQWDPNSSQFTKAQSNNGNVTRRLAGVQAARVEGLDGSLMLGTRNQNVSTRLLVVVQEKTANNSGSLIFGPDDGSGAITTPLFQVTDNGDLTIKGKFSSGSSLPPGTVSVQSGLATDGVILPLPKGVTEDEVTQAATALHIQVVPIVPDASQMSVPHGLFATVPLICYVDSHRRVHCVVRSLSFISGGGMSTLDIPGTCRYTLIASSAGTGGNGS